jgi:hypothetical protein
LFIIDRIGSFEGGDPPRGRSSDTA